MGARTNTTVAQDKLTQHGPAHGEMLQVVSFHVGEEEFGLDILRVQEIIRVQRLTRVPNSPKFVDGVINFRGSVITVIDLRKRFGIGCDVLVYHTSTWVLEDSGKTRGV